MSSRHMYIEVMIRKQNLVALVDTGASGFAFVSQSLVNRLHLNSELLEPPVSLFGFEGINNSLITHHANFPLLISNHLENISSYVVKQSKYDLILGLPWLEKHNPFINWSEHTITFGEHCFKKGCCSFETTISYFNSQEMSPNQKFRPVINMRPPLRPKIDRKSPTLQVSAQEFCDSVVEPGSFKFAFCLRYLEALIDDFTLRPQSLNLLSATLNISKDTNPRDVLPSHYHDFIDVFDRKQADKLPPHRPWDHSIDLQPGKQPPAAKPYSMNHHELKALRSYLDKELSKGFIRVSRSPAAAPVLFVKKANGDLRFCIDYRGLNNISVKNRHSLPLITETLSQLSHAKYFTKLDIISAFNKLRIKEGDEWKAAFTCRYGLFEPLVLPFGLSNGPASFQSYINHALRGLLDQFCTAYMDDILIYSKNYVEHQGHVKMVLSRLRDHGLQVDISKCDFEATEVTYLGLVISTSGIHMDPKKVSCIQEWPTPRSVRDIQCFLGFANFYRRFIPEFSRLASPLTQLTKKEVPFIWNSHCDSAFFQIKQAFKDGTMLAHFNPKRQTILETDASDFVTAAILSQYDESGILRPVAFMSKKKLPAECNYEIFDKELLAIVHAFETWTAELGSIEASTLILTDHKNLEHFTTTKKLNRRQVRWNELLSNFDFKIVFRPGKQGGKPDALTRISAHKPSNSKDERNQHQYQTLIKPQQILRRLDPNPALNLAPLGPNINHELSLEDWNAECSKDQYCQEIRTALMDTNINRNDIQLTSCELTEFSFKLDGKEYVPKTLRETVLNQLHDGPMYGHRGAAALYSLLSRNYWWPECHKDSVKYARGCEPCQRNNPSTQKPYGFLQPLPAPKAAFRHLTLDFIGPLPICKLRDFQYRFILQVVDRLTKRVWIVPLERTTAKETAEAFLNNVVRFAGLPDSLISDQGRTFIDKTWKEICKCLQITHNLSTSYHPQTDGQTERANKTLEVYLRHYVNYYQDNWAKYLSLAEFCCNNHTNASTGISPFFAAFGHHPRMDFRPESRNAENRDIPQFITRMKNVLQNCTDKITLAQAYQSTYANEKRLPAPRYQVGDRVYLSLKNLALERPTKKLDHLRAGPWHIKLMKSPLVAKLDLPFQLKIDNNFHVSLLPPAYTGIESQCESPPPPIGFAPSGHEIYEVEAILDSCMRRKKIYYLVRWTGTNEKTWEPLENLDGCAELLQEFHKEYPEAPRSSELTF